MLYENGVRKNFFVDELMADTFLAGSPIGRKILYVDGDYDNLQLTNLYVRNEARKRVREIGSGRIFGSQAACCEEMDVPSGVLSRCLSGALKSYRGMRFERIN